MAELDEIGMFVRDLRRVTKGQAVLVEYQPNRGKNEPKRRYGQIMNIEPISSNVIKFWFYDSEEDRKIEVKIGDVLDNSHVKSMKSTSWTSLGYPVRVIISTNYTDRTDVEQEFLMNARDDQYPTVVAAAGIERNANILNTIPIED